jgi:hypothetical protein
MRLLCLRRVGATLSDSIVKFVVSLDIEYLNAVTMMSLLAFLPFTYVVDQAEALGGPSFSRFSASRVVIVAFSLLSLGQSGYYYVTTQMVYIYICVYTHEAQDAK